jgi:hypothetical protein
MSQITLQVRQWIIDEFEKLRLTSDKPSPSVIHKTMRDSYSVTISVSSIARIINQWLTTGLVTEWVSPGHNRYTHPPRGSRDTALNQVTGFIKNNILFFFVVFETLLVEKYLPINMILGGFYFARL